MRLGPALTEVAAMAFGAAICLWAQALFAYVRDESAGVLAGVAALLTVAALAVNAYAEAIPRDGR